MSKILSRKALNQVWSRMFLPADSAGVEAGFSFEPFAVPHMFVPRLTWANAARAVMGAVARMLLGSLLFAVWAAYSFAAWQSLAHPLARLLLAITSLTGFLGAFAILMIVISLLLKKLHR